jgi:hypothetical protein
LARDGARQQQRLNRINQQIQDQTAQLDELQPESVFEQEKLDRINSIVGKKQNVLETTREIERGGEQVIHTVREPATKPAMSAETDVPGQPMPSRSSGAETHQIVRRTPKNTIQLCGARGT